MSAVDGQMTNADRLARELALEQATKVAISGHIFTQDVVETAEAYRKFLMGES